MPLLAFMLSACNGETLPGPVLADNTLQVCSVELPELSGTRALGATQLNEIGVYVTNNSHTALDNAPYVYKLQSGTWSCDAPPTITVEASAPDYLYAFSPSSLAVTNVAGGNHTIPVTVVADNFTASGQTDYLYGKSDPETVHSASRAVTFTMYHALAKVSFRVLKSDNVEETVALKKIELLSSTARLQTGTSGIMNLKDGILNGLASTNSIILNGSVVLNTTQSQPNVSALVAPMSARETRLSFRLTVEVTETDGTITKRSFETAAVNEVRWKAACHYVYAITIDKMGGNLTNVQIDAWKNDANQNTGIGI